MSAADVKHVELGLPSEEVTTNPMVRKSISATQAAAVRQQQVANKSMSRMRLMLVVLAVTNLAAIAVAVTYVVKDHNASSSSTDKSTAAVFTAGHTDVTPSSRLLSPVRSTGHFQRSYTSYKGTARENLTIASGVNQVLDPETGAPRYDVHTEMFVDGHFGEYGGVTGAVGDRALRMRVRDLETGEEVIFVPHSLSFAGKNASLIPNMYFFSYRASPESEPVATHLSTIVPGRAVLFGGIGADEWNSFMPKFFDIYERAWLKDYPRNTTLRRRLGFGSWAAGKVGGAIGGMFGDAGRDIGSEAAQNLYGGQSVGSSLGGAVGGYVGQKVGQDVGEDVGAAAGGALGTAIGGPVGGFIGEEVGGWAGRHIGGDIGHDVGEDLGSRFGQGIENDIKRWT